MDSLVQTEMFTILTSEMRQNFDLPECTLQWVKCRKSLQVAYFKTMPYKWERELLDRGVRFRTAWSMVHYFEDERNSFIVKYCETQMKEKIEKLFFCSRSQGDPSHLQHRFIIPMYKNSICNLGDKYKADEAAYARTLATAISERLGRGPRQMQAYVLGSSGVAYHWSGLLSVVEKNVMQHSALNQEIVEMEQIFKRLLAESVCQVHDLPAEVSTYVVFSEKMYRDQGLILVFPDGLK
ncbi:MAG: hypothetical protein P4N41_17775 [Negativicutes bacterium]|nr:hypothetical protein [Negativicutes bacterium]